MASPGHLLFDGAPSGLPGGGPLYLQLKRLIEEAVTGGRIRSGDALPSERDLAARMEVSRVTVRKAVQHLVADGVLVQRHGSGTYVASQPERVEQSLSQLTSFAEDMARRGMVVRSIWLARGLFAPSPEETLALGLGAGASVARVERLRLSGDAPLAVERAALSPDVLPDPEAIGTSLYAHLERTGMRPVRAVQRIRAVSLGADDARLLDVAPGAASLQVERTSYLPSGRVVEFTRSIYRGDTYDFVAELRLGDPRVR
jgi:GntR family transcriptional regulator